jgi:hypothetical protein
MTSIERTAYPRFKRLITLTAATNQVEAFDGFSAWMRFGNRGVIAGSDPVEQEKAVKFNALLTNCLIFRKTLDIAEAVRGLQAEGWRVGSEDLAEVWRASGRFSGRLCGELP